MWIIHAWRNNYGMYNIVVMHDKKFCSIVHLVWQLLQLRSAQCHVTFCSVVLRHQYLMDASHENWAAFKVFDVRLDTGDVCVVMHTENNKLFRCYRCSDSAYVSLPLVSSCCVSTCWIMNMWPASTCCVAAAMRATLTYASLCHRRQSLLIDDSRLQSYNVLLHVRASR